MDLKEIRAKARERLQGLCRACPVCDGRACIGEVPGMGGRGTGASFINNVTGFARVRLNLRTIHSAKEPDTTYKLFGHTLTMPVLGAPMCGTKGNFSGLVPEDEFVEAQVQGARAAGTLAMVGDGAEEGLYQLCLKAVKDVEGLGIPIIKPREPEEILKRIELAAQVGVPAVGIDIDAAGFHHLNKAGQPVGPKTVEELKTVISGTSLPVILKGIMTRDEALAAAEVGAAGIVVSNHGGRALDHTPGSIEVLPEIAAAVKGRLRIMLDGGVRSGYDVLKALALGAEAVLVGRPVATAAVGGQASGVQLQLEEIGKELELAMLLTGCRDLEALGPQVIFSC